MHRYESGNSNCVQRGKYLLANYLKQRGLTPTGYRHRSVPLAEEENLWHFNGARNANTNSVTTTRSTPKRSTTGLISLLSCLHSLLLLGGSDCCSGHLRNRIPGNILALEPTKRGQQNPWQHWPFQNKTEQARNKKPPIARQDQVTVSTSDFTVQRNQRLWPNGTGVRSGILCPKRSR